MYKTNNLTAIKNNTALGLIHEQGIHLHIHWLNSLFCEHKSS